MFLLHAFLGYSLDIGGQKMYALKSPMPQVMPNTILSDCGPHLVAFWEEEFR